MPSLSQPVSPSGYLRGPITDEKRLITWPFLKYLQNLEFKIVTLTSYTRVNLPMGPPITEGSIAFATNGRKVGEGPGAGTGVPVYFSNGFWRVYSTDQPVAV
jgi:hypothetical protein